MNGKLSESKPKEGRDRKKKNKNKKRKDAGIAVITCMEVYTIVRHLLATDTVNENFQVENKTLISSL